MVSINCGPATNSAPAPIPVVAGSAVAPGEFVSILAMGLAGIFCCYSNAAQNIFTSGNRLHVARVYANAIPAKVVNVEANGDIAFGNLIGKAVGQLRSIIYGESSVPGACVKSPTPNPASFRLDDLLEKSDRVRFSRVDSRWHWTYFTKVSHGIEGGEPFVLEITKA